MPTGLLTDAPSVWGRRPVVNALTDNEIIGAVRRRSSFATAGLLRAAFFGAVLAVSAPAERAEGPAIRTEAILLLRVECLAIRPDGPRTLASERLEVGAGSAGSTVLDVAWPEPGRPARVKLDVVLTGPASQWPARLAVEAHFSGPGGSEAGVARDIELGEGGSSLLEVWAREPERLVVVLTGEWTRRPLLRSAVRAARPVRLRLDIEAIRGDRGIAVETDDLATLLGEPVTYSFRRGGSGEQAESVELRATPVRIEGDIVQIEVEIAGRLPAGSSPLVLAERRRLVASRGAASALTVTTGDPPRGYRFLLTPSF